MSWLRELLLNVQITHDVVENVAELKQKLKEEQCMTDYLIAKVNGLYALADELTLELDEQRKLFVEISDQNRMLAGALKQLANAHSSASTSVALSDPKSKKIPGDDKPN